MSPGPSGPAVRRHHLAWECALLFGVLPAALAGSTLAGFRINPLLPLLLAAGLVTLVLLRDPSFDRACFRRPAPGALRLRMRVVRWLASAVILAAGLWAWAPDRLLALPRHNTVLWAVVCVLYPVVSVVPQGVLYRAFFHHRYAPLFGVGRGMALAGTMAFSWAHIVFLNPVALGLTLVGGWFFARTYQESRSVPAASLEHAAYGDLVFTLGWGSYLYQGTTAAMQAVLGG
jgi:hypothetical protein